MARFLPPYVDKNCKSSGEKQLFNLLQRSSFTREWIILHSLNISQHTRRLYGEIDFLIMIPGGGIFVIEVKGGDVKCVNGVWHYTDRYNSVHTSPIGPFNQARDAMFSIKSALEKEFGRGHRYTKVILGFGVAFPHVVFDKRSIEYEPWQILDKDLMSTGFELFFDNLKSGFYSKYSGQRWFSPADSLPSAKDLNEICDFLRGDFERIRTAREHLAEFNSTVNIYTSEQYKILDSIRLNSQSLIQGSAGTGKTMIAIESAIRSVASGKKTFLTCYNRFISEWMQNQVADWSGEMTCMNIHSYMFEVSKGFNYEPLQRDEQAFYSRELPLLIKDMFDKGILKKFDKLIIDEAQDIVRDEYFQLFDSMLVGGLANGCWELYGDFEKQAIYAQLSTQEMMNIVNRSKEPARFLLRTNCRNTKQIGEETALISGFETPPFLLEYLEGQPVEYIFFKNEFDQNQAINDKVKQLLKGGLDYQNMVILSPRKYEKSKIHLISDLKITELKSTSDFLPDQDFILFSTIQSFKGMESGYVLLADIEDLGSEEVKSLLYVGMSRAKYGLVVFISENTRPKYREIIKKKIRTA